VTLKRATGPMGELGVYLSLAIMPLNNGKVSVGSPDLPEFHFTLPEEEAAKMLGPALFKCLWPTPPFGG
jgi:hypothetical protein